MPRARVHVDGVVQGVGFRPFVYRMAQQHHLAGWVLNRADGVALEVEGLAGDLQAFLGSLGTQSPRPARIRELSVEAIPELGETAFSILPSRPGPGSRPSVPADLAMCPQCAQELVTKSDRRFGYPFTNCTLCGPRFSIIESLPYDRCHTGMKGFALCPECRREYEDPLDRRFHAEPVACPRCGPRLTLTDATGRVLGEGDAGLAGAAQALLAGEILALKGLGGFQLLVDASNPAAVARLRRRKGREEKPFAVMFASLAAVRQACAVSKAEAELLASSEAPVLLLPRRSARVAHSVAQAVAPRNPNLGAFLPSTPLHALLLAAVGRPLVCTSGNRSEEPMCIDNEEAYQRLAGIAGQFLVHDRPILRPVDDSVLRLDAHGPTLLRRARGYAGLAQPVRVDCAVPVLALGAQSKGAICLLFQGQAVLSQHLGDLGSAEGLALLERTVADLLRFFQVEPGLLACDLHPDYGSSRLGERLSRAWGKPLVRVQHHHAHVAACAAEWGLEGPVTGLAWDGSGLGPDGSLWGGESLQVDGARCSRLGHLRAWGLPGGEAAVADPRRSALGLLWESLGPGALERCQAWFAPGQLAVLRTMLERGLNTPRTSSMGRLFDAVAALLGIRAGRGFEGQAAMELEFAAQRSQVQGTYPWAFQEGPVLVADPAPLLAALLEDRRRRTPVSVCARRFHQALADLALAMARHGGQGRVLISGGCFQNALLLGLVRQRLRQGGFQPFSPRLFPPNDGGLALGQAAIAGRTL